MVKFILKMYAFKLLAYNIFSVLSIIVLATEDEEVTLE